VGGVFRGHGSPMLYWGIVYAPPRDVNPPAFPAPQAARCSTFKPRAPSFEAEARTPIMAHP
jgi:hypothetical protein